MARSPNLPLAGLTVLDFSTLLPGPLATLILAEAGAEVIKIERPGGGDDMRGFTPRWGDFSANFALLNRGKKSVELDLKAPADREKLAPLLKKADILVEQFRPGVTARLGFDYESVYRHNPRIIYCSITGYGQNGPKRDTVGHDLNYIGDAGLLALSYGNPQRPVLPPALLADIAGGSYPAVMNILMALLRRGQSGEGCHLDIAMADNVLPFLYWAFANGFTAGEWPGNGTDLVTGGSPRYNLYPASNGRLVAVAPIEDRFWKLFCELIGLEAEYRDDSVDPKKTKQRVAEIIAGADSSHWRKIFEGQDCACSIVADIREAVNDPHYVARNIFAHRVRNARGEEMSALPVPVDPSFRTAPGSRPAPALGSSNGELERLNRRNDDLAE
jgi:alpha-methylacyl-CoA racemase